MIKFCLLLWYFWRLFKDFKEKKYAQLLETNDESKGEICKFSFEKNPICILGTKGFHFYNILSDWQTHELPNIPLDVRNPILRQVSMMEGMEAMEKILSTFFEKKNNIDKWEA